MRWPLVTGTGEAFPGRDLILFLTFSAILATLVLQGLMGGEQRGYDGGKKVKGRKLDSFVSCF